MKIASKKAVECVATIPERGDMKASVSCTLPGELGQFSEIVEKMENLLLQVKLYPSGHPSILSVLEDSYFSIMEMLGHKKSLVFRIIRGSLCYLNYELSIEKTNNRHHFFLKRALEAMAIGEIEFERSLKKEELLAFMEIASSVLNGDRSFDLATAWTQIRHIKVRHRLVEGEKRVFVEEKKNYILNRSKMPADRNKKKESGISRIIGDVLGKLEKIQSKDGKRAGKMLLKLIANEDRNNSIVLLLKSLTAYDDYTFKHSVNVAVISAAAARYIGFEEDEAGKIGLAALMHDIGKIYVPKKIILKRGRLSPSEWQLIKKHPADGARILKEEGIDELICQVTYQHHMRHDFSGYPSARENEKLLDASEIVRIADTYDALTTKRAYRKQISPYQAIKMMARTRGSEFHPHYFDIFLHMMGNIPIGSLLFLESGETAVVVDLNKRYGSLPRVRVTKEADGYVPAEERILDLNELDHRSGELRYKIKHVFDKPVRDVEIGKYLYSSD